MIDWQIKETALVLRHMEELPDALVRRVEGAVGRMTLALSRTVLGKLSGAVLNNKTGKLAAAIRKGTYTVHEPARGRIVGVVGVRGADKNTAIAAGAQEYGASIAARIVEGKQAGKLKFQIGGKDLYRVRVKIPNVTIPERSFLRSSLEQLRPAIQAAINEAAQIEKVVL